MIIGNEEYAVGIVEEFENPMTVLVESTQGVTSNEKATLPVSIAFISFTAVFQVVLEYHFTPSAKTANPKLPQRFWTHWIASIISTTMVI